MNYVAVADIDVAQIMSREDNQNAAGQVMAAFESNPVVSQMLDAAQSIEDMYEAIKEYIGLKLEDFKVICNKTIDFLKGPKAKLDDDTMELVVGGFSCASAWNGFKKAVCAVAVISAMAVVGGAAGVGIGVGIIAATGLTPHFNLGGGNTIDKTLSTVDTIKNIGTVIKDVFKKLPIPIPLPF